jgi:PPM family protein phosphatase
VQQLIQAANDAGGPDNITVVLLRVEDDSTAAAAGDGEADEADEAGAAPAEPPRSIPIRTRPQSDTSEDWARDMGRYGDRQGVESGTGLDQRPRGRRVLGILTGIIVIAGILVAGGYLVLSRAYFIGEDEGNVAIFNGLPDPVAGIALHRKLSDTDIPLSALPEFQQQRIRSGIPVGSMREAEQTVEGYRADLEDDAGPSNRDAPEDGPTPDS